MEKVNLQANNQFCSVLHTSFFDPKQCNAMIKACVDELWMSGETVGGGVNKKVRHVEQQILPINDKGWPLTRILELGKQANNDKPGRRSGTNRMITQRRIAKRCLQ